MGQIKNQPWKSRYFLRLSARNCGLCLENIFFENEFEEWNITLKMKYSNPEVFKY